MFRQEPLSGNPPQNSSSEPANLLATGRAFDFDLQRELDRLEEMILDNPRLPLTRRTLVDEDRLLNQLDLVRMNLPEAFEKAIELLRQRQEILSEAEEYAQKILLSAKQRAAQIEDEMGIVQRAQAEAHQIQQQVQQECEAMQRQALSEIEQMRYAAQRELQEMLQRTQAECVQIQNGADEYADRVLGNIEHQLSEMLHIVRNGRQQLSPHEVSSSPPAR
jgi:F0F1-type ATP synthase membrane subunit b/b'